MLLNKVNARLVSSTGLCLAAFLASQGPLAAKGLGISADIGGISADVSIGGGSVASADVSVGGGQTASTQTASVSATVGGGHLATANVATAPGGTSVSACIVNCGTLAQPGVPGVVPGVTPVATPATTPPVPPRFLTCASKTGNATAWNGYPVVDNKGRMVGTVHSATLGNDMTIRQIAFQTVSKGCASVNGGALKVVGYTVRGAFDATAYGLASR